MLSKAQGEALVKLAREAIANALATGGVLKPVLKGKPYSEARGVFCTLKTYPGDDLRGCIGLPYPVKPLAEAVVEAAISAATGDPRFPEVIPSEFEKHVTVELTVLTPPEVLTGPHEDYPKKIVLGKHGLIIELGYSAGLLLPQVPGEFGWDVEEYLKNICWKAGLPPTAWRDPKAKLSVFEGQIFHEKKPGGPIEGA